MRQVTAFALGGAVSEIRQAQAASARRPIAAEYLRVLATVPADELPNLRVLMSAKADFTERLLTVLAGIAVRRGERWTPVLAKAVEH